MSALFKGLPQSLCRLYCGQAHNSINLGSWTGSVPFLTTQCSQLLSVPLHLHASPPHSNRAQKRGWHRNRSPHVKTLYRQCFSLFSPIKKGGEKPNSFVLCSQFPTSRSVFFAFPREIHFSEQAASLSPNVI